MQQATQRVMIAAVLACGIAPACDAAVAYGLLVDPITTAGPGSNSNRSGSGTWQLYAVDNASGNSGISSFDVALSSPGGTMTASNRSPRVRRAELMNGSLLLPTSGAVC